MHDNEGKSKVIKIRGKEDVKEIAKFEVVKEIKYLGIKIGGSGRSIFGYEKKSWKEKARIASAKLIAQVKKCYDMVTVGVAGYVAVAALRAEI